MSPISANRFLDKYDRIYKNGAVSSGYRIGFVQGQEVYIYANALAGLSCSATGEVFSIVNFNGNRFAFNTDLISAVASSDDSDVTISNGSLNYYKGTINFSTSVFTSTLRAIWLIALRNDTAKLLLFQARTDSDYIDIGCIDGFVITLFESAFPARQSVTVTATDGNIYSVTPDYSATLSGTDAADFILVFALKIGKRVADYLHAVGYDVKVFRFDGLNEICNASDNWHSDLFVSIHCNASDGSDCGTETYCCRGAEKIDPRLIELLELGGVPNSQHCR